MDVDQTNFEEILPDFLQKLKEASFISIDGEFSGLGPPPHHDTAVRSLFDDGEIRYKKAKIASCYFLCQFGIALFRRRGHSNSYDADCYNFYLYPASYGDFCRMEPVTWELSSVLFLKEHKFDFDRCFQKGIPFMNKRKTAEFRKYLETQPISTDSSTKTHDHCCGSDGNHNKNDSLSFIPWFLTALALLQPKAPINLPPDPTVEELVQHYRGFSRVIDEIIKTQKPIVGHNMYLDLILLYNHLYDDLPETYQEFKSNVHQIFPNVYDTKALAMEMKQLFCKRNPELDFTYLSNTSLWALYKNTSNPPGLTKPVILLSTMSRAYFQALQDGKKEDLEKMVSSKCHQAGFDACATGALFTQLAYIMWQHELSGLALPTTSYCENLLDRFSGWKGYVNISRAQVSVLNLAGPDPPSHRPDWICISGGVVVGGKRKTKSCINLKTIIRQISVFGDCEGIYLGQDRKQALVACCAQKTSNEVKNFLLKTGYNISVVPIKEWGGFQFSWKPVFVFTASVWTVCLVSWWRRMGGTG